MASSPLQASHPPPSTDNDTTVVVIVFVSLGGIFFLGFLLVGVFCLIRKSRKKRELVKEIDVVKFDEHMKMKEAMAEGPHGKQAVVLTVEDDVHLQALVRKGALKEVSAEGITHAAHNKGATSSHSDHHHIIHQNP